MSQLQFRKIPSFDDKPLPETSNPDRPKGNPFAEALEEDFVILRTKDHVVQLNKYCVYRPHLILHTKKFEAQEEPLNLSDVEAAWEVLSQLDEPYVVFYNCGLDAGSSQPHKHLQLIPKPAKDEFVLFPDLSEDSQRHGGQASGKASDSLTFGSPPSTSNVPFHCLVSYLPKDTSAKAIFDVYQRMLKTPHPDYPDLTAHNVIMTSDWICVIPRRRRLMLGVPANAMGMMGLIWIGTWSERVGWTVMGKTWHLETLGTPPMTS